MVAFGCDPNNIGTLTEPILVIRWRVALYESIENISSIIVAAALRAADSGVVRIDMGNGCTGVFNVPHGWTFNGGYGLSSEAARHQARQGLFYERAAEMSVGGWRHENHHADAAVEQWLIRQIGFSADRRTASVRVTDLPPNVDGTNGLGGTSRRRIDVEFDEAGPMFRGIHSHIAVLDFCRTAVVVTLRYFSAVTGTRQREWNETQDRLITSFKEAP